MDFAGAAIPGFGRKPDCHGNGGQPLKGHQDREHAICLPENDVLMTAKELTGLWVGTVASSRICFSYPHELFLTNHPRIAVAQGTAKHLGFWLFGLTLPDQRAATADTNDQC